MDHYENLLEKTVLFQGTSAAEIRPMLSCLGAVQKSYEKDAFIYHVGDQVTSMGLVLSGSVHVESNDVWGNHSILDHVAPGQVFAETYASIPGAPLMIDVIAAEKCDILFLNVGKILTTCPDACAHHQKLIRNLLAISAQKNLRLSRRIFHISPKSIRGRLMSYLSEQAKAQGRSDFTIPFNRQQLADYLNVDRSALSTELSKMQRDGLILVEKNQFSLLNLDLSLYEI